MVNQVLPESCAAAPAFQGWELKAGNSMPGFVHNPQWSQQITKPSQHLLLENWDNNKSQQHHEGLLTLVSTL